LWFKRETFSFEKCKYLYDFEGKKKSLCFDSFSELVPAAPLVTRFLNTRAMKETFKSYMELLVSIALDPDTMQALEKSNGTVCLTFVNFY